jgi:hypothetical protein
LIAIVHWVRRYLVATALVVLFAISVFKTVAGEVAPRPQHPPQGCSITRTRAQLQWSTGNQEGPIRLQVALDESFADPVVDKVVQRNVHDMRNLEPGKTYYWRVRRGDRSGPTASFSVAPNAQRFR